DTRAFCSHERPRDVETVFGKQLVEVVARHASRNIRVFRTDQVRIAIPNPAQSAVNFAAASSRCDDGIEFLRFGGPDGQLRAVIKEDFEFLNVIGRLSCEQRMSSRSEERRVGKECRYR